MKTLIYFLIPVLIIATFCYNGWTEAVVTDGLVGYWTFDRQDIAGDIAEDVWGKNDGIIVGAPKVVAGRVKDALEFDGSDDYVNLTTLGDFGSQIATSTFEAWIKPSYKEGSMTLFEVDDINCMAWGMDINVVKEPVKLNNIVVEDIISSCIGYKVGRNGCKTSCSFSSFRIFDGKWHHIVYTNEPYITAAKRETRARFLYIDGKRYHVGGSAISEDHDFIAFTEPVYLGARNRQGNAERFFHGIIDEVRIYNRQLTPAEVRQNFEIGLSVEPVQKLPTVWGALKTKL